MAGMGKGRKNKISAESSPAKKMKTESVTLDESSLQQILSFVSDEKKLQAEIDRLEGQLTDYQIRCDYLQAERQTMMVYIENARNLLLNERARSWHRI